MIRINQLLDRIEPVGDDWAAIAQRRLDSLTKPQGSLGRLEFLAKELVKIRRSIQIPLNRKVIFTFAADHGIAQEGVSLYPQSVTGQMVRNFLEGGAAVNVLASLAGSDVRVVDAGILEPIADSRLVQKRVGCGTKNFLMEDAMSQADAVRSIEQGADVFLEEHSAREIDLAGVGDMGIANSSSAAAVFCSLLSISPDEIVGRGTGLDDAGLDRKRAVIRAALSRRNPDPADPLDVLSKVGGFEIGEMAGCFLAGASVRTPMIVDGFISTSAALLACRLRPPVRDYLFFSHRSAEGGFGAVLAALDAKPILDLEMRLGEGTGTALSMPILSAAAAILTRMATFESAGVDQSNPVTSPS